MAHSKGYNILTMERMINLPKSYLELAITLLEDNTINHKIIKTLFKYKRDYLVTFNPRAKDINGYANITGTPIALLEFDCALKDVLEVRTLPEMVEDLTNYLKYPIIMMRYNKNEIVPISSARIIRAWKLSKEKNNDFLKVENALMFGDEE